PMLSSLPCHSQSRQHAHRFYFSRRRRHTRSYGDWSSDVCSSDLQSEVASFCISPTSMIPRPCNHKAAALRIALLSVTPDLPRSPWIFLVPEAGNVQIGNRRVV